MRDLLADDYMKTLMSELKNKKRKRKTEMHTLREIPKFVFVCGEIILDDNGNLKDEKLLRENNNKRYLLIEELQKNKSFIFPIISEKLYKKDAKILLDLLSFEEILCKLSDDIILILESDGTKCELGAFAMKNELVSKMCVLNDHKYLDKSSFISDGPIRKIREINDRTIFLNFEDMEQFLGNAVLQRYLEEIRGKAVTYRPNDNSNKIDVKYLIYELMGVLELFEPLTKYEIVSIYKELKDFSTYDMVEEYQKRFRNIEAVLEFMLDVNLINYEKDFFQVSPEYNYKCYKTLFNLKNDKYQELRDDYLELLKLKYKERWEVVR